MARYVMGVDGGGTGSRYALLDADNGALLQNGTSGAMNPFVPEALKDTAKALALLIASTHGECLMLRCGCAGAGESSMAQTVECALRDAGITCPVSVVGDHVNALDTAFGTGDGALLIAGTGSVCFARDGNKLYRAGGRGHIFDDGGSAYAIARDMLHAVAYASDGRSEATALTKLIFDATGFEDIGALTAHFTSPACTKGDIAALAPLIDQALAVGDVAAQNIANTAANELALLARAVCSRCKAPQRLAVTGSLLIKNARIRSRFTHRLALLSPFVTPFMLTQSTELGAAKAALALIRRN